MGDNTPRSIGIPMLIVVFVSICLFSFGGIAYSTARNSYEQSEGVAERAQNYYGACNEAERVLAGLDAAPAEETTYSFPFGTAMEELQVTIRPDGSGDGYDIVGWVVSDTASWEAPTGGGDGTGPQGPQGPVEGGPQGPTE
ncbi:MAG: hypothetical protein IJ827_05365 [Lachnospiraceae bacterium]|nr:hypothetical protein [Lachnospiraceae bacterium]MBR1914231.1 hypothetical protein [Lachnospiraceae bacterium]